MLSLGLDLSERPARAVVVDEAGEVLARGTGADGADVSATWERMRGDNPHIKYHSARRGYIACTATPKTMQADFKILDRVTVPDAPERTGGSLVVEAGRPGASTA